MIKVSKRIIMRISTHVDKTMSFLAPMTGNGFYIPPNKMVMTGGWFMTLFYPHYYSKGSSSSGSLNSRRDGFTMVHRQNNQRFLSCGTLHFDSLSKTPHLVLYKYHIIFTNK